MMVPVAVVTEKDSAYLHLPQKPHQLPHELLRADPSQKGYDFVHQYQQVLALRLRRVQRLVEALQSLVAALVMLQQSAH
jgi:hypothetical protein